MSQAQPKAKKKIPDETGRPSARSAKGRSKQTKGKKASSKKKPKTQLASDIRENIPYRLPKMTTLIGGPKPPTWKPLGSQRHECRRAGTRQEAINVDLLATS